MTLLLFIKYDDKVFSYCDTRGVITTFSGEEIIEDFRKKFSFNEDGDLRMVTGDLRSRDVLLIDNDHNILLPVWNLPFSFFSRVGNFVRKRLAGFSIVGTNGTNLVANYYFHIPFINYLIKFKEYRLKVCEFYGSGVSKELTEYGLNTDKPDREKVLEMLADIKDKYVSRLFFEFERLENGDWFYRMIDVGGSEIKIHE